MATESELKVLQVVEPGVDGVFRHVEGLVEYLLEQHGVKSGLAYSSQRGSERLQSLVERVRKADGPVVDLDTGNSPQIRDLIAYRRLRKLIRGWKPQVVHAHSSKAGGLCRLRRLPGSPEVLYTPNAYYGMGHRNRSETRIYNAAEKWLGRRGFTINVSPEERAFAIERLGLEPSGLREISNAVDFRKFRPPGSDHEKGRAREQLGIPRSATVIGSIGRLSFQKDPETLYRAVSVVRARHPAIPWCLLHAGDGDTTTRDDLSKLSRQLGIESMVVRPAYRSDSETLYRAMDLFCLSSRYEGLPLTVLEALASNLPIALTDGPGLRSFGGRRYEFSQVFFGAVEQPASLADAIEKCWRAIQSTRCEHRTKAEPHFAIESCYREILDLYRERTSQKPVR